MNFTRRGFLSASAALAAVPVLRRSAQAAVPREADIVVIGAGAAGIAAARRVMAANRKVILIESSPQIGGRCSTDAATFGLPFDRGARWLFNADSNPIGKLARGVGVDVVAAPVGQKIRVGRRNARPGETEQFLAGLVRANRAIDEAARGKLDTSCATALPKDLGDWGNTTAFVLGASATGKDLADLSAMDKARAEDRSTPLACRQGLGTLVGKLGESLPVSLATPATRIVWTNREVAVETPAGRIAARAIILTVSTNVLSSGAIKFTPELPKRQLEAATKLSLGSYDHIALMLSGNPLGLSRDEVIVEQSNSNRTGLLLANIGGSSLCTVDVAGSFGRELSAQGEAAMTAFAKDWIGKLFGSEAAAAVKSSAATRWNQVPGVLGAMSAAAPGSQGARKILGEPLGPLFIAGEATHETLWGTVDGAWDSGERAAEAALRRIGALKDAEPEQPKERQRSRRRRVRSASPED
jgi:monoamine oxidase